MIRIAICDSIPNDLHSTKQYVEEWGNSLQLQIRLFSNSYALLSSSTKFDIYLLEPEMPRLSGIELAAELRQIHPSAIIIFLSSSSAYALSSYQVSAFYYLMKPIIRSEFFTVLSRAADTLVQPKAYDFVIKNNRRLIPIKTHHVKYVEIQKERLFYHLVNETIDMYGSLKVIKNHFLSNPSFIQPHQSFLVNMNYITCIESRSISISGEKNTIPISRNRLHEIKDTYTSYIMENG